MNYLRNKAFSVLALLVLLVLPSLASAQGIRQLQQFTSTTTPISAITQTSFGKPIKVTGLTASSNNLFSITFNSGGSSGTAASNGMIINDTGNGSTWDTVNPNTIVTFSSDDITGGAGPRSGIGSVMNDANGQYARLGLFLKTTSSAALAEVMSVVRRTTNIARFGIGTTSPATRIHIYGTSSNNDAVVRIESITSGELALSQTSPGVELIAGNMGSGSKYTPFLKFGTTDSDLTTTVPKFGAAIGAYASETYTSDTSSGMGLEFFTTPSNAGTSTLPFSRMVIDQNGLMGIASSTPWGQLSASSTSAFPTLAVEQKSTGAAAIFLGGNVGIGTTSPQGNFSVQGPSSGSATRGTCFRAKDVGATTFTYWWFKAGVQTTQTANCGGTGTTTITYD